MGEAKRKALAGARISHCKTCTLCCTLSEIIVLEKPMFVPCRHLANQGCGVFGQSERPAACNAYECAYYTARRTNASDRHRIPHPLDAGAYFHKDPIERAFVLFVDPARPEIWKRSGIVDYLRPFLGQGYALVVLDRGRRMTIRSLFHFEEILKMDYVAFADAQGLPKDIPSFEEAGAARTRTA